jgi:hypothetical protein
MFTFDYIIKNNMDSKKMIWIGMIVGSTIGSLIPVFFGGSEVSLSSVIWGAVGGFTGIYVGYKMSR